MNNAAFAFLALYHNLRAFRQLPHIENARRFACPLEQRGILINNDSNGLDFASSSLRGIARDDVAVFLFGKRRGSHDPHFAPLFELILAHVPSPHADPDAPYSMLAMTKPSEYSDESRLEVRPAHGKYLFVYPFVKSRAWYGLAADERWRIMQEHIRIGREYPSVDLNTSYSFGLDDQEFVVAFETDNPADFVDLVQRLRTTEASSYTLRDTPTFTCISCSVERMLGALDGAALTLTEST